MLWLSKLSFGISPTQFARLGIKAKYAKSQKGAIFFPGAKDKSKIRKKQKRHDFFAGAKGKSKNRKKEQ